MIELLACAANRHGTEGPWTAHVPSNSVHGTCAPESHYKRAPAKRQHGAFGVCSCGVNTHSRSPMARPSISRPFRNPCKTWLHVCGIPLPGKKVNLSVFFSKNDSQPINNIHMQSRECNVNTCPCVFLTQRKWIVLLVHGPHKPTNHVLPLEYTKPIQSFYLQFAPHRSNT